MAFKEERLRPALDLLRHVSSSSSIANVVDLGCGTGSIVPFFKQKWPRAQIFCVDSSQEMLETAKATLQSFDRTSPFFIHSDFESFTVQQKADVIFSNAALHWVSFEVHQSLLPRLLSFLKPGGQLAFQMPDTRLQPSHTLMVDAATNIGLDVSAARKVTTEVEPQAYYKLLSPSCATFNSWSSEYVHVLDGNDPVFAFTSSTGLGPFVAAVGPDMEAKYINEYKRLLRVAYPRQADGKTLFPFRRFFTVATVPVLTVQGRTETE